MASTILRFVPTGYETVDQRLRELYEVLRRPLECPLLLGRMVEVELPVGSVTVNHKLGRQPLGYVVVDRTGAAPSFYRTAWDALTITLSSATASTVTLWVF